MKITSFNPLIVTYSGDDIINLYEDLGFKIRHTSVVQDGGKVINYTMEDDAGHRVDVAQVEHPMPDLTIIRMNVSDFDEAFDYLIGRGFKSNRGEETIDSKAAKSAMMISPSGFAFDLCQHIKD